MVVLDIGVALEWLDPVHKLVSPAGEKGKKRLINYCKEVTVHDPLINTHKTKICN